MPPLAQICEQMRHYGEDMLQLWESLQQSFREDITSHIYQRESKRIRKFIAYDCRPTFRLAFFGEQSCGKSTFINALLNANIVPAGAAEVTFAPTVIAFSDCDSMNFCYYTKAEIQEVIKPYCHYLQTGTELYLQQFYHDNQDIYEQITAEQLRNLASIDSVSELKNEHLQAIYYVLKNSSNDPRVGRDFVNLVYALRMEQLQGRLSHNDIRISDAVDKNAMENSIFILREQATIGFPEYQPHNVDLYKLYLINHIYKTVSIQNYPNLPNINRYIELIDLPGIDAVSTRVHYAALSFLQQVDALILLTETQKSFSSSTQDILKALKGYKLEKDQDFTGDKMRDSLFVVINKYDMVTEASDNKLEEFSNTVQSIYHGLESIMGTCRFKIFVTSSKMTQLFRKKLTTQLSAKEQADLDAYLVMKNAQNLSQDPRIDEQIRLSMQENEQYFGGIPLVWQEIDNYLQTKTLTLKVAYFKEIIQAIFQVVNAEYKPLYEKLSNQWHTRDHVSYKEIKNKAIAAIDFSLNALEQELDDFKGYLPPLDTFGPSVRKAINETGIREIKRRESKLERYRRACRLLTDKINQEVEKYLIKPQQDKLVKILNPLGNILDAMQQAPEQEVRKMERNISYIREIYREILLVRIFELIAERPLADLPSQLLDKAVPGPFDNAVKKIFLSRLATNSINSCNKIWCYHLYYLQQLGNNLQQLKNWFNRQTKFSDFWLQKLATVSKKDQVLHKRYKQIATIDEQYQKLQDQLQKLEQALANASY